MREYNDDMIRDLLPDFVRGDLSEEMQQTVAARIATNPDLQAEADLLRAFLASVGAVDVSHADVARISLAIPPYDPVLPVQGIPSQKIAGRHAPQDEQISPMPRRSWGYRWFASAGALPVAATFVLVAAGITAVTMSRQQPDQFPSIPSVATTEGITDSPPLGSGAAVAPVTLSVGDRPMTVASDGIAGGSAYGVTLVGVNTLSDDDLVQLIHSMNDDFVEPVNGVESAVAVTWGGLI